MAALPRRIVKETQRLLSDPPPGVSATPFAENMRYFNVVIAGPINSPYEGGIFKLELFLPEDYPMSPLKVRFLTQIYHPNIDKRMMDGKPFHNLTSIVGRICLDVLKTNWTPALQIRTVLLSIQALLSAPNPADPLDTQVADHWTSDETGAIEKARKWTQEYATQNQ